MGKLICLYGINNLGKSTQAKLLLKHLQSLSHTAHYLKYPIYNLKPTGPFLNLILRDPTHHLPDPTAKQLLYTANRFQYAPTLQKLLQAHDYIIAEDYIGTGLAWGSAEGADLTYLEKINAPLHPPDFSLLLDGKRFSEATETNHAHENNSPLLEKSRQAHLHLAQKYSWPIINANQPPQEVHQSILTALSPILNP